jgi:ribosomal-protein-alanine N-acetyltransferase
MIEVRRLAQRDLKAIERIERLSYPTPWSRSMFASEMAKPSSVSLGAFEAETGELLGYLVISRYVDAWHVMNVAVEPEHRRQGIALALFERLFAVTGADGRRGYTLEVRISNQAAIKLYERLGFQSRGVRRGYYTDNREDALIMWRDHGGNHVSPVSPLLRVPGDADVREPPGRPSRPPATNRRGPRERRSENRRR